MCDIGFIDSGFLLGIIHFKADCEDGRDGYGIELLLGFFSVTWYFAR